MKCLVKNSVKMNGVYLKPGSVVEFPKDIATSLIAAGAVAAADAVETPPETPAAPPADPAAKAEAVEELTQVKGVNDQIAGAMFDAGITSIEMLQKATKEQLVAISGIGNTSADKIMADAAEFTFED